jgi:hypothetical protein
LAGDAGDKRNFGRRARRNLDRIGHLTANG